jgi:hypothetical protein
LSREAFVDSLTVERESPPGFEGIVERNRGVAG